jgi:hypothetical protein
MAAMRDRVEAQLRLEEARIEALEQERWLRLQAWEREQERQSYSGIPLDAVWSWVGAPAFPFNPHQPLAPPGHGGQPGTTAPQPAAPPAAPASTASVPPQHNRSSIRRVGD